MLLELVVMTCLVVTQNAVQVDLENTQELSPALQVRQIGFRINL